MRRLSAGMYGLLLSAAVLAQAPADPEHQRRLAEQKLKLVEMLVNAPAAKAVATGQNSEAAAAIERGRSLLGQAREALAAQRYPEAASALDEALRSVSKANSRNSGALSESVQKQRLQDMAEQVATYRASLAETVKHPAKGLEAQAALGRVDALADEARRLGAAGRLGDANKKMAEAYKLAVEEISRLRAGETVTMALKFNSPAEEYAYEQKRLQSNEILVNMMIADGKGGGERKAMVDGFVSEAARLKAEAAGLAGKNQHKEAVAAMEKAFTQLNRALQAMGVPAF